MRKALRIEEGSGTVGGRDGARRSIRDAFVCGLLLVTGSAFAKPVSSVALAVVYAVRGTAILLLFCHTCVASQAFFRRYFLTTSSVASRSSTLAGIRVRFEMARSCSTSFLSTHAVYRTKFVGDMLADYMFSLVDFQSLLSRSSARSDSRKSASTSVTVGASPIS